MVDTNAADAGGEQPLMVFSSDTHVGPSLDHLRPYCEQKYLAQYDEFARTVMPASKVLEANLRTFSDEYRHGMALNLQTEGHHDPHARLRDMDRDGVSGAVIFHNTLNGEPFPFDLWNGMGNGVPSFEERELVGVGRAIYNRWLSDFCSVEPERHVGLAQLPMWDIPAAIKELEVAAEAGLRGVNFPAPGAPGMAQPDEPEFDEFFAACAANDMTLATHIGARPPKPTKFSGLPDQNAHAFYLMDGVEWGLRTISTLVWVGAFERHPNLKLVLTEYPGNYWVEMNAKMDSVYYTPVRRKETQLPKPPSAYTETNVWIGNSFQSRSEALEAINIGREDRYMWGSDYPHPEGTYSYAGDSEDLPMTRLALANTYHGLPVDKVRRLVGANALECYPLLDGAALSKVADRVGPSVAEFATAPDLEKHSVVKATGTLAFRTVGAWN